MSDFKHLNVLVADDDTTNQRVLRAMFTKLGCRFTMVVNGQLAVEAARATPFDLILMDLQMPVMDGLSAAREIRTFSRAPILAISGSTVEPARLAAAGIDDTLDKPIRIEALSEKLARWSPSPAQSNR